MNIGIVTTWFERGAAYVSKQFEDVLAKEHNVFIYARGGDGSGKGNPTWDKPNVTWGREMSSPVNSTVIDKRDFINWIKQNNIGKVIFNEQRWFIPIIWCKELNITTIAYIDYYTQKTIPLFEIFDYLICNTLRHYDAFKWHAGATYIPWGTNVQLFSPVESEPTLTEFGKITIFHSAGMNPYRKGTDQLIKAFHNADKSNAKLIIHSQVDLKHFFPELKYVIDDLLINNYIEIITTTIPAPGLYYKGDIYIYPARLDGLGLTMAEAISSGLVLVVPDNAPMNEFYSSKFGELIEVERMFSRSDGYFWPQCEIEIKNLTEIINRLCKSREQILQMKREARKYALKYLDWEKNSMELLVLINKEVKVKDLPKEVIGKIRTYENSGSNKLNNLYLKFFPFSKYILKRL